MNTYTVQIDVMPLKDLLDPQGKAIIGGLKNLNVLNIQDVRVGKSIHLTISATDEKAAISIAQQAAELLLVNPVMEYYTTEIIA